VRLDAAPQGALGGERDGNGSHFERRDAELFEMCGPGRAIQSRPTWRRGAFTTSDEPADR
jgi:hypothetical protein